MFTYSSKLSTQAELFITSLRELTLTDHSKISLVECEFDLKHYQDLLYPLCGLNLYEPMQGSVAKRKAELLAGRVCAYYAMDKIGVAEELTIGKSREPNWPIGIIGAITHTNNSALCAVISKYDEQDVIGIDREKWIPHSVAIMLQQQILQQKERALLEKQANFAFNKLLTICFSAKESIFKAYFVKVGEYFDFKDANLVSFSCNGKNGQCQFILADWLKQKIALTEPVTVDFFLDEEQVTSLLYNC